MFWHEIYFILWLSVEIGYLLFQLKQIGIQNFLRLDDLHNLGFFNLIILSSVNRLFDKGWQLALLIQLLIMLQSFNFEPLSILWLNG